MMVEAFRPEPVDVESTAPSSSVMPADSACINVEVFQAHVGSHGRCLKNLEREEAERGEANPLRVTVFNQHTTGPQTKIKELMADDL